MSYENPNFNPYSNPSQPGGAPASKKSGIGTPLIIICITVGVCLTVIVVCCGACGILGYVGIGQQSEELADELRFNPVIQEHIGDIETFEYQFWDSSDIDDYNTEVYAVKGTKGSGEIVVKYISDDDLNVEIEWAELTTSSGEKHVVKGVPEPY